YCDATAKTKWANVVSESRVPQLVEQALEEFDDSDNVSKPLRRCMRIASLRNDYRNLLWLQMEGLNADVQRTEPKAHLLRFRAHFSQDEGRRFLPTGHRSVLRS